MSETSRLTVVGAGYVGLATAVGLAVRGYSVDLVETRSDRVESLISGVLPIHEPAMELAFGDPATRSRIHVSAVMPNGPTDMILVCVGTPVGEDGRSDLTQLRAALESAAAFAAGAPIVIRSTMPAGSGDEVAAWAGGDRSRIFTNPEFLVQGRALEDFLTPSRVVIGTFAEPDSASLELIETVLCPQDAPLLVVSVAEADMIKNGANAFLALKISFVNELAVLCEELDADVLRVVSGIGLDPRIGSNYMRPSFGFGGRLPAEGSAQHHYRRSRPRVGDARNLGRLGRKRGASTPFRAPDRPRHR